MAMVPFPSNGLKFLNLSCIKYKGRVLTPALSCFKVKAMKLLVVGAFLIFTGRILNILFFPASWGTLNIYPHVQHLWYIFDDIIPWFGYYASIGDFLQWFGFALAVCGVFLFLIKKEAPCRAGLLKRDAKRRI